MKIYYSQSTRGFYHTELHGTNMPEDVVEITEQEYIDSQNGHSSSKEIVSDNSGKPILVDQVVVALTYREKRQREYPPIGDQLDAMWKGGEFAEAMLQQVMSIKNKYPKE